jgi:hypothetical protein
LVPNEKESFVTVGVMVPELKSQYDQYGKKWRHELKYQPSSVYHFRSEQGEIFKALHDSFMKTYKPVTTLTLVRADGSIISRNLFINGRSEVHKALRGEKFEILSTSESMQLEMQFSTILSKRTALFQIDSRNGFLLSGLHPDQPFFFIHGEICQVVVFLDKQSFSNLKDVKVETKWMPL